MSILTLGQASKLVGVSKPTISTAIRKGKLTGKLVGGKPVRDKDGKLTGKTTGGVYEIEKSELLRVYEEKPRQSEKVKTTSNTSGGGAVAAIEKQHLEEKVADLEARLSKAEDKAETAEIREREANARVFALIEDKRPKSLLQRMLGK